MEEATRRAKCTERIGENTVRDLEEKLAAVRRECDMLKEAAPSKGPGLDVASALAIPRAARSVGVAERRVRIADKKAAQMRSTRPLPPTRRPRRCPSIV